MGKMTSVVIDESMVDFIGEQVSHGNYGSASDVIAAGLKLLRDQAEIEAVSAAIEEGEASGEAVPFDFEEFLEKKRAERQS